MKLILNIESVKGFLQPAVASGQSAVLILSVGYFENNGNKVQVAPGFSPGNEVQVANQIASRLQPGST